MSKWSEEATYLKNMHVSPTDTRVMKIIPEIKENQKVIHVYIEDVKGEQLIDMWLRYDNVEKIRDFLTNWLKGFKNEQGT